MSYFYAIAFLLAAGINSAAQLLLKKGALVLEPVLGSTDSFIIKLVRIATNPFVIAAVASLGAGMLLWLKIISKVELSRAYPINIALTVLITSFVAVGLFEESMTWMKFTGIALIIVGLWAVITG